MRLPFLRSKPDAGGTPRPAAAADDTGSLQAARTQARRRLIGSLVLLVAAVVGFPLLFETQPRPMPGAATADGAAVVIRSDAAARSPGADSVAVRRAAPAQTAAASSSAADQAPAAAAPPSSTAITTAAATTAAITATTTATAAAPVAAPEPVARAPAKPAPAASAAASAAASKAVAAALPAAKPAVQPAAAKPPEPAATTKASEPAASATSAPAADGAVRWVVQVGAYNDMERMRQARQKAEKLGFKTYITDVDTPTGKRTRVRLGPFATKKDAEAAAVKVKANGMAANVLSL